MLPALIQTKCIASARWKRCSSTLWVGRHDSHVNNTAVRSSFQRFGFCMPPFLETCGIARHIVETGSADTRSRPLQNHTLCPASQAYCYSPTSNQ